MAKNLRNLSIQDRLDSCGVHVWDATEDLLFEVSPGFAQFLGLDHIILCKEDIARFIDIDLFRLRCSYIKSASNVPWDMLLNVNGTEQFVRTVCLSSYVDDEGKRHWVGTVRVLKDAEQISIRNREKRGERTFGSSKMDSFFKNVNYNNYDAEFAEQLTEYIDIIKDVRVTGGLLLGFWRKLGQDKYKCVSIYGESLSLRPCFNIGDIDVRTFFGRHLDFHEPTIITNVPSLAEQYPIDASRIMGCGGLDVMYIAIKDKNKNCEWGIIECVVEQHQRWTLSDTINFKFLASSVRLLVEQTIFNIGLRNRFFANSMASRYGGLYFYFWDIEHNVLVQVGKDGEAVELAIQDVLFAEDMPKLISSIHSFGRREKESDTLLMRLKTTDVDHFRWFEITVAVSNYTEGGMPAVVIGMARDIDEKIKKNEEEKKKQEFQNKIYDNLPVVILFTDPDGKIRYVNNRAVESFGIVNAEQVIGVNIFDDPVTTPEQFQAIHNSDYCTYQLHYDFSRVNDADYYTTSRNDAAEVTSCVSKLYKDGVLDGYMVVLLDTTTIAMQRRRLYLFSNIIDEIGSFARVGVCLFGNEGFSTAQWNVNLGLNEPMQTSDSRLVCSTMDPADLFLINSNLEKINSGQISCFRHDAKLKVNDKRRELAMSFLRSQSTGSIIAMCTDITERKEMMSTLAVFLRKAEKNDSLRAHFFNNVSHTLRTPLNAIVGFSGMIAEKEKDPGMIRYANIIKKNNVKMLSIVDDILEMSLLQTGDRHFHRTMVEPNAVLAAARSRLSNRATDKVRLCCSGNADLEGVEAYFDKNVVLDIICRLAENAFNKTRHGSVNISSDIDDDKLMFHVYDTGCGISKEALSSINNSFFTVDAFEVGAGMGLAVSNALVRQMGGELHVESTEGCGTHASISLPFYRSTLEAQGRVSSDCFYILSDNNNLYLGLSFVSPDIRIVKCGAYNFFKRWMVDYPQVSVLDARICPEAIISHVSSIHLFGSRFHSLVINSDDSGVDDAALIKAGTDMVFHPPFQLHTLLETISKIVSMRLPVSNAFDYLIE